MGSTDWDEVGKALLRSVEENRVKDYIRKPLEEIIDPLSKGEAIDATLSMDVMMVLVFIHFDLMGYLYTADTSPRNSSKNAVKFIREYLGRIDARYKEVGGLLYHMLRHGWIHKYTPKRLRMNDGGILDFLFSFSISREQHLSKTAEIEGAKRLNISVSLLYNDLLSALDLFAEDVRQNQELSDVFKRAFQVRREPEEENVLRAKYNRDIDFISHLMNGGN